MTDGQDRRIRTTSVAGTLVSDVSRLIGKCTTYASPEMHKRAIKLFNHEPQHPSLAITLCVFSTILSKIIKRKHNLVEVIEYTSSGGALRGHFYTPAQQYRGYSAPRLLHGDLHKVESRIYVHIHHTQRTKQ